MSSTLSAVSLFSGAMGLDLGLERAGFSVRLAADIDPAAIATVRGNRPDLPLIARDLRTVSGSEILAAAGIAVDAVDLLGGGPPCQSFSTAGKRLTADDLEKGPLVFEFLRLVGELRPRAFLLENVKGLTSASRKWRELPYNNNGKIIDELHGTYFEDVTKECRALGYTIGHAVLNAADYGVPQTRHRLFVIGYRDGQTPVFPAATHSETSGLFTRPWVSLGEALEGLEQDDSPCNSFSPRKLKYLRDVPEGGNWRDLPLEIQKESMGKAFYAKGGRCGYWRRLSFVKPAPTILTEPQNASTSLCHPTEDRPLSVRECARIQTFPDDWRILGRRAEQYRLVGNAVPIVLATALGLQLSRQLREPTGVKIPATDSAE